MQEVLCKGVNEEMLDTFCVLHIYWPARGSGGLFLRGQRGEGRMGTDKPIFKTQRPQIEQ